MSLTSYRAAPPRDSGERRADDGGRICPAEVRALCSARRLTTQGRFIRPLSSVTPYSVLCRPGGDLLSQVLRHSTIGARAFDGRVRDGIGSSRLAKATRPAKNVLEDGGRRTEDARQRTDKSSIVCLLFSVLRTKQNWLSDDAGWSGGERMYPSSVVRCPSSAQSRSN